MLRIKSSQIQLGSSSTSTILVHDYWLFILGTTSYITIILLNEDDLRECDRFKWIISLPKY